MKRSVPCLWVLFLSLSVGCSGDGDDANDPGGSGAGGSAGSSGGATGGSSGTSTGGNGTGGNGTGGTGGTSSGGTASGGASGSTPQDAVTVTGSGFGTKASPGPVVFDDFESGAVGTQAENQPARIGTWQTGAGSEAPVYADEVVRTGARSCKAPFTQNVYNASLAQNLDFTVAYLDYWTYVAPLDSTAQGFTRNWKPFRLYGESDQLQSGITTLNGNESAITYFDDLGAGSGFAEWTAGYPVGTWFHVQYWLRMNDVGSANGTYRARIDGDISGESGVVLRTGNVTMSELRIGHYWATDGVDEWPYENSGANVYLDDVYFDTSWARVEIANAADYDSATQREIQIVTSWSDTAVTFVPSKGTLPAGQAWAFVLGENDQVLASQAITLQ